MLRYLTAGETHGPQLTAIIEGMPSNLPIDFEELDFQLRRRQLGYGRGRDPDDPEFMFRRDVDYCSGAFLLTQRAVFDRLGRFDPRYAPAYYEETDYCVRLWQAGIEFDLHRLGREVMDAEHRVAAPRVAQGKDRGPTGLQGHHVAPADLRRLLSLPDHALHPVEQRALIVALVGGIQLFTIGVLGEYVGRIFLRATDRPQFVVADAVTGCDANRWRTPARSALSVGAGIVTQATILVGEQPR